MAGTRPGNRLSVGSRFVRDLPRPLTQPFLESRGAFQLPTQGATGFPIRGFSRVNLPALVGGLDVNVNVPSLVFANPSGEGPPIAFGSTTGIDPATINFLGPGPVDLVGTFTRSLPGLEQLFGQQVFGLRQFDQLVEGGDLRIGVEAPLPGQNIFSRAFNAPAFNSPAGVAATGGFFGPRSAQRARLDQVAATIGL